MRQSTEGRSAARDISLRDWKNLLLLRINEEKAAVMKEAVLSTAEQKKFHITDCDWLSIICAPGRVSKCARNQRRQLRRKKLKTGQLQHSISQADSNLSDNSSPLSDPPTDDYDDRNSGRSTEQYGAADTDIENAEDTELSVTDSAENNNPDSADVNMRSLEPENRGKK